MKYVDFENIQAAMMGNALYAEIASLSYNDEAILQVINGINFTLSKCLGKEGTWGMMAFFNETNASRSIMGWTPQSKHDRSEYVSKASDNFDRFTRVVLLQTQDGKIRGLIGEAERVRSFISRAMLETYKRMVNMETQSTLYPGQRIRTNFDRFYAGEFLMGCLETDPNKGVGCDVEVAAKAMMAYNRDVEEFEQLKEEVRRIRSGALWHAISDFSRTLDLTSNVQHVGAMRAITHMRAMEQKNAQDINVSKGGEILRLRDLADDTDSTQKLVAGIVSSFRDAATKATTPTKTVRKLVANVGGTPKTGKKRGRKPGSINKKKNDATPPAVTSMGDSQEQ